MKDISLQIDYRVYHGLEELPAADRELAEAAIQAQQTSYAPYSKFHVGAAIRMAGGTIVKGSNQENAASPSGLCAERTALFAASAAYPGVAMEAIAITGGYGHDSAPRPCTPCGACRQVMAEYQMLGGRPMEVLLVGKEEIWKFKQVDDILPFIFDSLEA